MIKGDPKALAVDILERSICRVQVGAVLVDGGGRIMAWGWNSVGKGFGICAERHAISRSNRDRLDGSTTIYVAAKRRRNGKVVSARPCVKCRRTIDNNALSVVYRDANGRWVYD